MCPECGSPKVRHELIKHVVTPSLDEVDVLGFVSPSGQCEVNLDWTPFEQDQAV